MPATDSRTTAALADPPITKHTADTIIAFAAPLCYREFEIVPFFEADKPVHQIYVARNLLFAVAYGDPLSLPGIINVRFVAEDEWPASPRECRQLGPKLWEKICAQCAEAESRAARGEFPIDQLTVMSQRFGPLAAAVKTYGVG